MKHNQNKFTKIIFLCSVLVLGCFGADEGLQVKTSQKSIQSDFSWFFGVGLGVGLERLKAITNTKKEFASQNFASLVASAKIGLQQSLTQQISLRYYYSFDISFNPGTPGPSEFFMNSFKRDVGAYTILKYHMLNIDTLFKAYTFKNIDFGLIAGIGAGLIDGVYAERFNSTYFTLKRGAFLIDWDIRLNLGMQLLFENKHGIELLAKIPLKPTTINTNIVTHNNLVRQGSAYFTLDYVMRF